MDQNLIDGARRILSTYCEGLGAQDTLTLFLVSGEKLTIKSGAAQDELSEWFDLVDVHDNDISVRLDQVAAIRHVEGGGGATAMVI